MVSFSPVLTYKSVSDVKNSELRSDGSALVKMRSPLDVDMAVAPLKVRSFWSRNAMSVEV